MNIRFSICEALVGVAWAAFAANPVYVNCNLADYAGHDGSTPEKAVASIQEGVDLAQEGAVVHVAAGVYSNSLVAATENFAAYRVYIKRNLTLKGAGRDVTHIVGAFANTSTNIGPGAVGGIVISSTANHARIEGFTIRTCGDSKKSNGANGDGTAIRSLKTGNSLTVADRPWVVDCAVSNVFASVGAVSYVNVARTIFMKCQGNDFASVADRSDLVFCIAAHNQQVKNSHLFRGSRVAGATGNRLVNCTVVDTAGSASSVNMMSTGGPYYLQNTIVDMGGVYARELDGCVFANTRGGLGSSGSPVTEASTNETATSFFNRSNKVIASVVTDDFRPIAPCDLVPDGPAYARGFAAHLEAFPEEFRGKDVYGNPVMPDAEGRIHAGAVQTPMTPVTGFTIKGYGAQLRINGGSFCRSNGNWSERTVFSDAWPTMFRLEFPRRDELAAAGLAFPFFGYLIQNDGVGDRNVFPDSNERMPLVTPKGRVVDVTPRLATHVLYVDRAAENGDANAGSGTEAAPYARIQKAVNSVPTEKSYRAVIYVAPGTYDCDLTPHSGFNPACRVNLDKSSTLFRLIGTGGAEQTIIPGAADTSALAIEGCLSTNAIRCVKAGGSSVVLQGFTLTGGHTAGKDEGTSGNSYGRGGALWANNSPNAWLVECIVTNNVAYHGGAAIANGNAVRCYFADNKIVNGGSIFDVQNEGGRWLLSSCVVNETNLNSKGTVFLQSSATPGYAVNCSVRGNEGCYLFNTNSYSFFLNSILTHAKRQSTPVGYRRFAGTYVWEFDFRGGVGNAEGISYFTADPQFIDPENGNFRILRSSPAYGGGIAWTKMSEPGTSWTETQAYSSYYRHLACDMDGNFPIFVNGNPSAGAYQTATQMKATLQANRPDDVVLTPAAGDVLVEVDEPLAITATSSTREILGFNVNGTFVPGAAVSIVPADYSGNSLTIEAVANTNWFVDAVNGRDTNTGWTDSASFETLTEALAHATSGDVVTALPGTYDKKSALHTDIIYYYGEITDTIRLPSRAVIPDGVTLISRDGPEATIIKGAFGPDARGCGEGAIRCVLMGKGAVLKGFTVTGGGTLTGSTEYKKEFFDNTGAGGILSADVPQSGGCGWQPKAKGYAENCIISNNTSMSWGGAFFGSYVHCLFTGNRGGAVREAHYMYDCVVGGNYGIGETSSQACYQPYFVDSCTFLGTDLNVNGQPVASIYSYPGSSYWVVQNSLFLGTKGNTLKWVFNCRFAHKSGLINRNDDKHCWENVEFDESLAVDANYRPVRTSLAVDAWRDGRTSVSNAFHFVTPAEYVRDTDFAGGPRMYNGTRDVGAGECDWRPRYAAVLGGGTRHQVTAASTNVVEVETGVQLTDGQALTSAFNALQAGARQCEWTIARTGAGTLTVSVNGGEPQIVASETFSPTVVKGANTFAFAYTGDGSAVLQRFAHFNGTMLIFR